MQRTVLVVDDNEHERAIFSRFLSFVGGQVIEAANGEEGVREAQEHLPTLILLDLSMPVMDGWETLRRLQANPLTEPIPVIALTARHLEWERLAEAGFCAYLEKPIVPVRVLREVERCIGPLYFEPPGPSHRASSWGDAHDLQNA
jgi:CheY-like chemotaxis protein